MLADRVGRRQSFLASALLISVFGFVSGASPDVATLITFRAIAGFGIGGASIPFDLMSEFMPISQRGAFGIYIELFWTFGAMMVAGLAWGTLDKDGWHNLAYYTAIPVAVTCVVSFFYLPESPRWLVIKGRRDDAVKVLGEVALINGYKLPPFTLKSLQEVEEEKKPDYRDLFATPYLAKITTLLTSVFTLYGFTYYGMILLVGRLYTDDTDDGSTCSFDYSDIFINTTAEIVGVFMCAYILSTTGRVTTMQVVYFLAGFGVLILAIPMGPGGVNFFAFLSRAAIMAATNVTWVITPELYPTELRTIAHCFCLALSRIAAFISPFVVISPLSTSDVGVIMGLLNLIACGCSYFLPETRGKICMFFVLYSSHSIFKILKLFTRTYVIGKMTESKFGFRPGEDKVMSTSSSRVLSGVSTDVTNPLNA